MGPFGEPLVQQGIQDLLLVINLKLGFYQNYLFRIKYKFMKQEVLKNQKEIQETHDCFQNRYTSSYKLLYI